MLQIWMIWKYLKGGGRFINWTSFLALLGLILAVGCLILTMAVISGVESHLKKAIIDVSGHFVMIDNRGPIQNLSQLEKELQKALPQMNQINPFVQEEGLIVSKGILSGVLINGLAQKSYKNILYLEQRLLDGSLTLKGKGPTQAALLGGVLANKLKLNIGDTFQIVIPRPHPINERAFQPRKATFYLAGTLDMGKHDYNERIVFVQDSPLQKLKGWRQNHYSGLRISFESDMAARRAATQIGESLGYDYYTDYYMRDWYSSNRVFFSEVAVQKWVIFVVLLFIVIVACFNLCSTLFIHVLRRFSDISVLQTLGATRGFLLRLFISYGLFIGVVGCLGGLSLGWVLCQIMEHFRILYVPSQIYQFDHLPVEIRWMDVCFVLGITLVICFLSTLLPAFKGSRIKPIEGLHYE